MPKLVTKMRIRSKYCCRNGSCQGVWGGGRSTPTNMYIHWVWRAGKCPPAHIVYQSGLISSLSIHTKPRDHFEKALGPAAGGKSKKKTADLSGGYQGSKQHYNSWIDLKWRKLTCSVSNIILF